MKYALSALLGSLVSTIAVVLAGHTPALLVGLGFVTAVLLYTWILRLLGVERYARWFYAGAGHPVKQGTGHLGKLFGGGSSRPSVAASNSFPIGRENQKRSGGQR